MAQEKNSTTPNRKDLLEDQVVEIIVAVIMMVMLGAILYLKLDHYLLSGLSKLFSYIPLLKLIPQNVYTSLAGVLDAAFLFGILACVWDIVKCLGGMVTDCLRTSFLRKATRYWKSFFFFVRLCAAVIFLRLCLYPQRCEVLWLRELGEYVHTVFYLDTLDPTLTNDILGFILFLANVLLQCIICYTGAFFLLSLVVVGFSSLRELVQNPKPRQPKPKAPKAPKAPKQTKHKPKLGTSGLRKDVAQEADSHLAEYLSAQEPPREDPSCLRVQIMDRQEINPDRLYQWDDCQEIYVRLPDYELTFLRQDEKAYLLGSEQLELRPNVPEIVWMEGRTRSQKLILTYIV